MIYNFRFDRNNWMEILRRLREQKLLSQGWGGGSRALLKIEHDGFVQECQKFYQLSTRRIPSNMTRIRDFKDGDLLVTPHLPEYGKVSVHIVDGNFPDCYDYLEGDQSHLNHRIRIKNSYGLDKTISVYNEKLASWKAKLSWLRLPILPIQSYETVFREIIETFTKNPQAEFGISDLDEYLETTLAAVIDTLKQRLVKLSTTGSLISFEALCERLLVSNGYRIESRHKYNRKGGDIDLRCIRDRSDGSQFETGQTTLFVQVKKHRGTTDDWAVQQVLSMLAEESNADGCVMSLADDFSDKAKKLANENGIALIDGDAICKLLLKELSNLSL